MKNLLLYKIEKLLKTHTVSSVSLVPYANNIWMEMFTEHEKMIACRNIITGQKSDDKDVNDFQRQLSIARRDYKPEDIAALQKLEQIHGG